MLVGLAVSTLLIVCGLVSLTGLLLRPCPLPLPQFVRGIGSIFEFVSRNFKSALFLSHARPHRCPWRISVRDFPFLSIHKWRASRSPLLGHSVHVVHLCFGLAQLRAGQLFWKSFVHFLSCLLLCCAQSSLHLLILGFNWCRKKKEREREKERDPAQV